MKKHDVIIIGGGPGGSTLGALLAGAGLDVGLFEKENFPRFRIGESLLPSSMDVFRESGVFDKLDTGKYIRKFGAQFINPATNEEIYFDFSDNDRSSLAMAFEVPRADFDADLLAHAVEKGVTLYQPEKVVDIAEEADGVTVTTDRGTYAASYLADATGRIALIGNKQKMRVANPGLNNVAVFAHFEGVKRKSGRREGDIIIGLLPGGAWSWTIPFQGKVTSLGIVMPSSRVDKSTVKDDFIETTLRCCPLYIDMLENAKRISEVHMISNYSHTCETFFGKRWVAVGDAAAFLDPIFSSGVHVSVSSARFASKMLLRAFAEKNDLTSPGFGDEYEKTMRRGVKRFRSLIELFYTTDFVTDMKRVLERDHTRQAFTGAVAGDVWNDDNVAFKMGAL